MTRGLRGATALVAVGAFVAVAIAGPRPAAGAEDDRTLRIGTTQEFDSINPNLAFIGASAEASNLDYDVLVGVGPDGTYVPTGFAESWTRRDDVDVQDPRRDALVGWRGRRCE
jgi:ABC-type transport system substrate-binding protein